MSTRVLITFVEFEQYEDDDMRHELIEGEHLIRPPATIREVHVREKLRHSLHSRVQATHIGQAYVVAGFLLSQRSWLQPDASVVRTSHIDATDLDYYYCGAPAIAIEIASDTLSTEHLELKTKLYLAHGSEEVWVVFPKTRSIRVHTPDAASRTVSSGDLTSAVLPGWSIAVDSLFEP